MPRIRRNLGLMGDTILTVLMAIYGAAIVFAFWVALKR